MFQTGQMYRMSFLEQNSNVIATIATLIGIPGLAFGLYLQIRTMRKDRQVQTMLIKENAEKQQEKTRKDITEEINTKTTILFERIEGRLEAIKIAAIITKEDITNLKVQANDLRRYVDDLDKTGTIEWKKSKPFLMERIEDIEKHIEILDNRFTYSDEQVNRMVNKAVDKKYQDKDDTN